MDATSIHAALAEKFGPQIKALVTANPDPYIVVEPSAIAGVCRFLKDTPGLHFDFLMSISGVDTKEKFQVVYHLFSYTHRHSIVLKIDLPYDAVKVPSVTEVWAAANWHEREQYDLFGFEFAGHPDLRRILLPEDWIGFPLRKNYEYPDEYHGIDHHRDDPKEQFKALDELVAKAKAKKEAQSENIPVAEKPTEPVAEV